MPHISYIAPDGVGWRFEMGAGPGSVTECFGLSEADLPEWHGSLCEQGRLWEVPRRMFAGHVAMGASVRDMVPQSAMEIAAGLSAQVQGGVSEREVMAILERAKTLWARMREAKARAAEAASDFEEDAESLNERNAKAAAMLLRYGFREEDADVRAYMIMRAGQLEPQLESDEDRPAAMQMLRDEVSLNFSVNPHLDTVQRSIREILGQPSDARQATKLDSLHEKQTELIAASESLRKSIEAAKKSLALGESATGRGQKKEAIQDMVSQIIKGVRDWRARADKRLLDGVHTEGEVRVLLRPYGDRAPQYRIDLALMLPALMEGLHDPDFEMPAMKGQRSAMRMLQSVIKSAMERMEQGEFGAMENLQDDAPEAEAAPSAPVAAAAQSAGQPMAALEPAPADAADDPDLAFV